MWEGHGSSGKTGSGRQRLRDLRIFAHWAGLCDRLGIAGLRAGVGGLELDASVLQQQHLTGFPQAVTTAAPPELFAATKKMTVEEVLPPSSGKGATQIKVFNQRQD